MELEDRAFKILAEVVKNVSSETGRAKILPSGVPASKTLRDLGISLEMMPDILDEVERRSKGKKVELDQFMNPSEYDYLTLDRTVKAIAVSIGSGTASENPMVVYVDDEEENLFVFKRKFSKILSLKLFTNPMEALEFIQRTPDVALVITDEVMPQMGGNILCDRVQETKPNLPFILITGNPNQDEDLMYRSLRRGRFFEFFHKPLDLDGKGVEMLSLINSLIGKR